MAEESRLETRMRVQLTGYTQTGWWKECSIKDGYDGQHVPMFWQWLPKSIRRLPGSRPIRFLGDSLAMAKSVSACWFPCLQLPSIFFAPTNLCRKFHHHPDDSLAPNHTLLYLPFPAAPYNSLLQNAPSINKLPLKEPWFSKVRMLTWKPRK